MTRQYCNEGAAVARLAVALLASGILACSLVDDEPPMADTGGSAPAEDGCLEQLEAAKAECLPGMSFHSTVGEDGDSIIPIDDPGTTVEVGPNAWLVQAGSEEAYVAGHVFEGPTCTVACGWCEKGQSMCYQGFDDNGTPVGCFMCLPFGIPDARDQCAAFLAACDGPDQTGDDG